MFSKPSTPNNGGINKELFVDLSATPGTPKVETVSEPTQELPPPIFTNEEFCALIEPIVKDAVAGDLPPEYIEQLPSPNTLKLVLNLIQFDKASGALEGLFKMDPKRTLIAGLVATGAWTAWVAVKANMIRTELQKKGLYAGAKSEAMKRKQEEYRKLYEQMKGGEHGNKERNQSSGAGQFGVGEEHTVTSDSASISQEKSER